MGGAAANPGVEANRRRMDDTLAELKTKVSLLEKNQAKVTTTANAANSGVSSVRSRVTWVEQKTMRCLSGSQHGINPKGVKTTFSTSFKSTPTFTVALGGVGKTQKVPRKHTVWYRNLSYKGVEIYTGDAQEWSFYATWMACGH